LRDTTLYIQAADQGLGMHELHSYRKRDDLESWQHLITWLDQLEKNEHRADGSAS